MTIPNCHIEINRLNKNRHYQTLIFISPLFPFEKTICQSLKLIVKYFKGRNDRTDQGLSVKNVFI